MEAPPSLSALGALPGAFATACRQARSDGELFEHCRDALVRQFKSDRIWLRVTSPTPLLDQPPPPEWVASAVEVIRLGSGPTEVAILAEPAVARELGPHAAAIALGLSVMLELHGVLRDRQSQLEDAAFQLRALRQVARLLSSVHSVEETENLVLDFVTEVFFCSWAVLYRPVGGEYLPRVVRSHTGSLSPESPSREELDRALTPAGPVTPVADPALALLLPSAARLVVSLDAGDERLAILALGPRLHDQVFGPGEEELAGTLAFAAAIALKNAHLVEQLQNAATSDVLTGLSNRRAMELRLEAELARTIRHQIRTCVILIDVDRFKSVNDTLGHAAGDRLLCEIGRILRQQARTLDSIGRIGGDEFLVVLPMTTAKEARVFVQRVQQAVHRLEHTLPEFGRPTLSMGIAEAPLHGSQREQLLAAADSALYRAKRAGRDAVEIATDP